MPYMPHWGFASFLFFSLGVMNKKGWAPLAYCIVLQSLKYFGKIDKMQEFKTSLFFLVSSFED